MRCPYICNRGHKCKWLKIDTQKELRIKPRFYCNSPIFNERPVLDEEDLSIKPVR